MKKVLLLSLVVLFSHLCYAQQQLATLNHNGDISVFYGIDALQQAHGAAANGDVITLSSGNFHISSITKNVTIRGAGMWNDTLRNTTKTIISNQPGASKLTLNIALDSVLNPCFEGMFFNCPIEVNQNNRHTFIKCEIAQPISATNSSSVFDTTCKEDFVFVNCIINHPRGYSSAYYHYWNSTFVNCIVFPSTSDFMRRGCTSINCVIFADPTTYNVYENCMFMSDGRDKPSLTCFNCVGFKIGGGTYFASPILNNCWKRTHVNFTWAFTDFSLPSDLAWENMAYSSYVLTDETFRLTDTAAATYIGTDGTQVGIYGGIMPFNPYVGSPHIGRCNVANRSTIDGKLSVDFEIISEE